MPRRTSSRTLFAPTFLSGHTVAVTLVLLALLAAVFLRGFTEAIGIAVGLVAVYLALNVVVISVGPVAHRDRAVVWSPTGRAP